MIASGLLPTWIDEIKAEAKRSINLKGLKEKWVKQ